MADRHPNVDRVVAAARELCLEIEPRTFPEGTKTAQDAADAIGVALDGLVDRLDHRCRCHNIIRTGGTPGRLVVWKLARIDEVQPRKAHVFHRTRHAANIAAVRCMHEHNVDVIRVHQTGTLKGTAVYQNRIRFSPALL